MRRNYFLFIFSLVLIFNLGYGVSYAETKEFEVSKITEDNLSSLQEGGYVIYIRHGKTDTSRRDYYPVDLDDCSKQRPLNDEGRTELKEIRKKIKKAKIPIANIYSSPMCRAEESTEILFGDEYIVEKNLMYTAQLTTADKKPIIDKTRELLSKPLEDKKKNRVLVAHAPNLADLIGYFPEIEASVIIFRPLDDGKFEYIGTIIPNDWDELINNSFHTTIKK